MCTGRIDLSFVLRAFSNGEDGVYIGGCWPGQCHYITDGNYHTLSMVHLCRKLLEQIGVDPQRLRLEWTSAGEGIRFAEIISDFTQKLRELGPLGIDEEGDGNGLRSKLEAARSLVPYIKLVERERLRVRFDTIEEYDKFFASDEVDRLFKELVADKLAISRVMLLLRERPLSTAEISGILDLSPSEVSRYLDASTREGLVRFDESQNLFVPA